MFVKTEKQKMPFVPNFGIIFLLEGIFMLPILFTENINFIIFGAFIIFLTYVFYHYYLQKFQKLWRDYLFLGKKVESEENFEKQKNILKILAFVHKKMPYFPMDYKKEFVLLDAKIKNFLSLQKNEKLAISHIASKIEDYYIFSSKIEVEFSQKSNSLKNKWLKYIKIYRKIYFYFSIIIAITSFVFIIFFEPIFWKKLPYEIFTAVSLLWSGIFISIFYFYEDPMAKFKIHTQWEKPSFYEVFKKDNENSENYIDFLQKSAFYHAKLDDFYNFVFHENNFLPETPLLFADIITLLSENFAERKNFLEKYRKLWKNGLKLFFIFPAKIPTEVEKIISEEEKNLANEIKNIQNKIREWAEFEKKKIAIISKQNKEFFPNLELSNKRQEILIKNFENLSR